jgi:formate hydrogenlyase subunit 3/multisubunit Na+/H+ antiporter MnhD subunit
VQRDFWRLLAYAALSHLSLIVLAIYGLTFTGWSGAVYQILSHGVVDGALFLLLGALELRYGTSLIDSYGGLAARLPRAASYFVIATLAMIGLPMLSGFIGEFIILSSTVILVSTGWGVAAALGVILGATYMLWLVQRLFYGPESALATSKPSADLHFAELSMLTPLVVLMLVMGLAPSIWLRSIQTGVHPPPRRRLVSDQASQRPTAFYQAPQKPAAQYQSQSVRHQGTARRSLNGVAEKLLRQSFVIGHEFTRADQANQINGALAAATTNVVILSDRSAARGVEGSAFAFSGAGAPGSALGTWDTTKLNNLLHAQQSSVSPEAHP